MVPAVLSMMATATIQEVSVRKMTGTEEEMFFQDFWRFDLETPKPPKEPPSKAIGTGHGGYITPTCGIELSNALLALTPVRVLTDRTAAVQLETLVSLSPTRGKAMLLVAAADRLAPERSKTVLKDTRAALELQEEDAASQDTLVWAL
ncbi:MAG: hypothetical protein Q9171_004001, partial [Xanthocarpia ochracea]